MKAFKRAVVRTVRRGLRVYVRAARPAAGSTPSDDVTILLSSAWGMGGTIRAAHNLAGYLAERHRVEVISVVRRREQPFFPLPERAKVTALDDRRPGATPLVLRPLRAVLVRRSSVLVDRNDLMYPEASLWTDVVLARKLRGRTGFLIGTRPALNLLAAELSRPGLIVIGQEQVHLRAHNAALRHSMRRTYGQLDALVVLTDRDLRRYQRMLGDGVRLARIPNTITPELTGTASLEGFTVLAAGRLTPQKGFGFLIKAFARIAPAHPEWRLVICGEGPLRPTLERLVARHHLEGVVALPGPVDPLAAEMDRAALFVLSSRFEGFPLVLLEAMAKGLPVVATDCPTGPAEIVEDGRNGILVPRNNVKALAAGMHHLMSDEQLRRRLGAAAAETAKGYTMDAIGPHWERLLKELHASAAHDHTRS
jgi:glycosyltransferase involved in cell wall biosynthesis